ncbi:MAG: tRNA (adenosine(37)-N6)-threonylcarbamoyltransferase complex dimerization subunit type 1 TsaB [Bacteroidota bacterium]|jgi:tRNA threonylcarbamoyladenosine biosynthesis protein TsaB
MILHIETATDICSVVLADNGVVIAEKTTEPIRDHASSLAVFIDEIFKENNIKPTALKAIAVSKGPGSYTGLRIGVSTAKGLCYALNIPLIAIATTQSMANQYYLEHPKYNGYVVPLLDARRMEVYGAVYNQQLQEVHPIVAEILHNESFSFQSEVNYMLIGSGAAKSISFFESKPNVTIDEHFSVSAIGLVEPAFKAYQENAFEDIAYFEPFYLKDFVSPHFKPEN